MKWMSEDATRIRLQMEGWRPVLAELAFWTPFLKERGHLEAL